MSVHQSLQASLVCHTILLNDAKDKNNTHNTHSYQTICKEPGSCNELSLATKTSMGSATTNILGSIATGPTAPSSVTFQTLIWRQPRRYHRWFQLQWLFLQWYPQIMSQSVFMYHAHLQINLLKLVCAHHSVFMHLS